MLSNSLQSVVIINDKTDKKLYFDSLIRFCVVANSLAVAVLYRTDKVAHDSVSLWIIYAYCIYTHMQNSLHQCFSNNNLFLCPVNELPRDEEYPAFTSLACSIFQKVCVSTHSSGKQPLVMSLIPLPGD